MTKTIYSRILTVFFVLLSFSIAPAIGQDVMGLQVTASSSQPDNFELKLDMLDALDQVEFTTTTIWTDGETQFSGVSLKALLTHLGLAGSSIEMVALNDYAVTMPVADLEDGAPIVATRMNGEIMSVRGKGPYWVVFPYDSDPRYSTETVYSRSIWQLNRLKVIE